MRKKRSLAKKLAEKLHMLNDTLDSLLDPLEEKGILMYEQWDPMVKRKGGERADFIRYMESGGDWVEH